MEKDKFTEYHPYIVNAGKELKWLPSDTEELYKKNLKENYNLLKKFNWIDSNITYKFNKNGFRSNEFCEKDNVLFLGCSYTFGIGLPIEKIYSQIICKKIGLECFNLGLPGSSNDTAFRLAHIWIARLKPKLVVLLSPQETRFELLIHDKGSNDIESRFITTIDQLANTINQPLWLSTDQNGKINREKNKLAITYICDNLKIKFLDINVNELVGIDFARDLMHPGALSHQNFANKIINLI
jgi:hypothetical protein